MKPVQHWWIPCLLALQAACSVQAQSPIGSVNRYGSSGLLTIPTADIAPAGSFDFLYNRTFDPTFGSIYGIPRGLNLMFVTSPYQNIELGARLAEYAVTRPGSNFIVGGARDLSANVKMQMVRNATGTRAAIGVNDVAGGAVNLRNAFGVVTQDIGPFSLTGGYSVRAGTGRKGVLAGVRVAVADPLFLMADVDPYQAAVGARAQVPLAFLPTSPRLDLTLARSKARNLPFADANTDVQMALRFSLDHAEPQRDSSPWSSPNVVSGQFPAWPTGLVDLRPTPAILATEKALQKLGFGNVMVRSSAGQAWVRVQNVAFKHSHFDAVAVVLGAMARELPEDVQDIYLQLQVSKLDVAQLYAKRSAWQRFMGGGVRPVVGRELMVNPQMSPLPVAPDVRDTAPIALRIEPVLRTFFGTEVGAVDYALAARAVATWEGIPALGGRLMASASLLSGAATSDSFKPGGVDVLMTPKAGLEGAMLHWAGWTTPTLLSVASVGKHDTNFAGAAYEGQWVGRQLPFGMQGTGIFRAGHFRYTEDRNKPGVTQPDRTYARASVRAYIPQADLTAELGAGQFQAKDRGASLDLSRNFGDVNFAATWRYTDRQFFGIQMGFPLTPRVNRTQVGVFHIAGTNSFVHDARTSYLGKGQANLTIPTAARMPQLPLDVSVHLMDRNRLTDAQMYGYLLTMRDFARRVLADDAVR